MFALAAAVQAAYTGRYIHRQGQRPLTTLNLFARAHVPPPCGTTSHDLTRRARIPAYGFLLRAALRSRARVSKAQNGTRGSLFLSLARLWFFVAEVTRRGSEDGHVHRGSTDARCSKSARERGRFAAETALKRRVNAPRPRVPPRYGKCLVLRNPRAHRPGKSGGRSSGNSFARVAYETLITEQESFGSCD